jgi:hypothetical protein
MPQQNFNRVREVYQTLASRREKYNFVKSLLWDASSGRIISMCNKALINWLGTSSGILASVREELHHDECDRDTERTHGLVGVAPANITDPATAKLWTDHISHNTRGNALDTSLRCIHPLQSSLEGMRRGYIRENPKNAAPERMTWINVAQAWMEAENHSSILAHRPSHNVCPTCKGLEVQLDRYQFLISGLKTGPRSKKTSTLIAGYEKSRDSTMEVWRTHLRKVGKMSRHISGWIDFARRTVLAYNSPVTPKCLLSCEAVLVVHVDDKKALTIPHPLAQSDEDLAKWVIPINGGTDMGTGNFVAHLTEVGSGSKDSNFSVNHLLLHLTDGRFNGHQVVFFLFDCAPTERNSYVGGGFIQMLVDRGIVKAAFAVFLVNNHGKHECDRHFGVMEKKYNRSAMFSIDQMADQARGGTSGISGMQAHGFIVNPLAMNDFASQFKEMYDIPFPREIGAKTFDPHLMVAVGDLESITDPSLRERVRPYARREYDDTAGPGWLAIQQMPGDKVDFHYMYKVNATCSPAAPLHTQKKMEALVNSMEMVGHNCYVPYARGKFPEIAHCTEQLYPPGYSAASLYTAPNNWIMRDSSKIARYPPMSLQNAGMERAGEDSVSTLGLQFVDTVDPGSPSKNALVPTIFLGDGTQTTFTHRLREMQKKNTDMQGIVTVDALFRTLVGARWDTVPQADQADLQVYAEITAVRKVETQEKDAKLARVHALYSRLLIKLVRTRQVDLQNLLGSNRKTILRKDADGFSYHECEFKKPTKVLSLFLHRINCTRCEATFCELRVAGCAGSAG